MENHQPQLNWKSHRIAVQAGCASEARPVYIVSLRLNRAMWGGEVLFSHMLARMRNVPHRFTYLNTRALSGNTVNRGLGGVTLLEDVGH